MSKKKNLSSFPCTDTGNAELIAGMFGDVLRYDHRQNRWLVWNKRQRHWSEDKESGIRNFAIDAARHRRKIAADIADTDRSKREFRWAYQSEHRHRLDAALEIAKSLAPISDPGDGWDADPFLLGVANGVVELRKGTLRLERPDDRIIKHSPVRYNAAAKCPRFETFLGEVFNNDVATINYVQRVFGYCLTGSTQEQCVFCWYGSGANGKTTLHTVLRHILGDYAVNLPFSALEIQNRNSNDLVHLVGARLATAAETNEGVRLNEARIKVLSGGDPITARKLYHESFTFISTQKLVLAFNHKPTIADDSEGMWRRLHPLPFNRQFKSEEQDKSLGDALRAESPGILAWAVRGCQDWLREEDLATPAIVREATATYRAESDHLGQFLDDCCIIDPGGYVTSQALWTRYHSWATENEVDAISRRTFKERLERRAFRRDRTGQTGTRIWRGLCLLKTESDKLFGAGAVADTQTRAAPTSAISN
jgi:putative DNA primase/helicase